MLFKEIYKTYHSTAALAIVLTLTLVSIFVFLRNTDKTPPKKDFGEVSQKTSVATNSSDVIFRISSLACNPKTPEIDLEEKEMLKLINNQRAKVGAPALQLSGSLNDAADIMVWDQNAHGWNAHTDSTGGSPQDRMRACGYTTGYLDENAGYNSTTEKMFEAWMNSQPHRESLEFEGVKYIGIARAPYGSGYAWITDFNSVDPGGTVTYDDSEPTATPTKKPLDCDSVAQAQGFQTFTEYCSSSNLCVGSGSNTGGTVSCACTPCLDTTITTTPVETNITPTATTFPGTLTPTATINPNDLRVELSLGITGIGTDTSLGQNNQPVRSTRTVTLEIYDAEGNKAQEATGDLSVQSFLSQVQIASSDFGYKGIVNIGNLSDETYIIKARFDNTLLKDLGFATLKKGEVFTIQPQTLVSGDLNQDNVLDLADYNALISCFGTKSCSEKEQSDLNVDGKVDEKDLNIFYSGLANRLGD